jgi:hypothetical protein
LFTVINMKISFGMLHEDCGALYSIEDLYVLTSIRIPCGLYGSNITYTLLETTEEVNGYQYVGNAKNN